MQRTLLIGSDAISHFLLQRCRKRRQVLFLMLLLLTICIQHGEANAAQLHTIWTDNANNEDGFEIERKIGENGTFGQIAIVGANLNLYTDDNLIPGTTYCYRVRAFNTFGKSGYSDEAC